MPGRVEELYKMHLIIAPRWMREINGFPFSEPTVLFLFFLTPQNLNLLLPLYFTAQPPRPPHLLFPVTPSWIYPSAVPVMRATPEFVITSRQWKVICRFTARWTCSIPLPQFRTFYEWKASSARTRSSQRNVLSLYLLHLTYVDENCVFCRERWIFGSH